VATPTIKDAVLAWMRETGSGSAEAAQKFGVKAATVRQWVCRERQASDAPVTGCDTPVTAAVTPPARPPRGTTSAAFLSPDARVKLRGAIHIQLDYLANDENKDQRARDAASRALRNLLDSCPDILTFEERLDGRGPGAGGGEDLAGRLRAALGIADGPG